MQVNNIEDSCKSQWQPVQLNLTLAPNPPLHEENVYRTESLVNIVEEDVAEIQGSYLTSKLALSLNLLKELVVYPMDQYPNGDGQKWGFQDKYRGAFIFIPLTVALDTGVSKFYVELERFVDKFSLVNPTLVTSFASSLLYSSLRSMIDHSRFLMLNRDLSVIDSFREYLKHSSVQATMLSTSTLLFAGLVYDLNLKYLGGSIAINSDLMKSVYVGSVSGMFALVTTYPLELYQIDRLRGSDDGLLSFLLRPLRKSDDSKDSIYKDIWGKAFRNTLEGALEAVSRGSFSNKVE